MQLAQLGVLTTDPTSSEFNSERERKYHLLAEVIVGCVCNYCSLCKTQRRKLNHVVFATGTMMTDIGHVNCECDTFRLCVMSVVLNQILVLGILWVIVT